MHHGTGSFAMIDRARRYPDCWTKPRPPYAKIRRVCRRRRTRNSSVGRELPRDRSLLAPLRQSAVRRKSCRLRSLWTLSRKPGAPEPPPGAAAQRSSSMVRPGEPQLSRRRAPPGRGLGLGLDRQPQRFRPSISSLTNVAASRQSAVFFAFSFSDDGLLPKAATGLRRNPNCACKAGALTAA